MKKEGQAWGFDLVIGMVIFIIGIFSFYLYTINLSGGGGEVIQQLEQNGELVADSLMSEGSPLDWNAGNVVRIGLLSEDRINQTKLDGFRTLAGADYARTKSLFRINNEYFVYLDNDFAGGIGRDSSNANNLFKISRVIVYDQKVTTLNVYSWN